MPDSFFIKCFTIQGNVASDSKKGDLLLKPEAGGWGEFFILMGLPRVILPGDTVHSPQASVVGETHLLKSGDRRRHESHMPTGWHRKHLMRH